jgi:hypothetical protein
MTDDQNEDEHEPEEPEPQDQDEELSEATDGGESPRRGLTVRDFSEAYGLAGIPLGLHRTIPGFPLIAPVVRQSISADLGLGAHVSKVVGDAIARSHPGLGNLSRVVGPTNAHLALSAARSLADLGVTSPLEGLNLRHLMPGSILSRRQAFDLARSDVWRSFAERWEHFDPANWRREDLDREAMLAVLEEGIPLVWTPSVDVIRALLDAPDAVARRKVVEERTDSIVEDCRDVLREVSRNDLASQVDLLRKCLDLVEAEHHAAAQALATSALDTVLRAMVRADASLQDRKGRFTFRIVAQGLPKATMQTTVGRFRAYCINTSIHVAYVDYWGPPVPEAYNRHATAHGAGPTQLTPPNALCAVMLASGILRELEETQRPITPAD